MRTNPQDIHIFTLFCIDVFEKHYHSKNIVSLDIYFNDLHYDDLEQLPMFELWDLSGKCHSCVQLD